MKRSRLSKNPHSVNNRQRMQQTQPEIIIEEQQPEMPNSLSQFTSGIKLLGSATSNVVKTIMKDRKQV